VHRCVRVVEQILRDAVADDLEEADLDSRPLDRCGGDRAVARRQEAADVDNRDGARCRVYAATLFLATVRKHSPGDAQHNVHKPSVSTARPTVAARSAESSRQH